MRHVDSFEIQAPPPPAHNGVPRSAWSRTRRRVSRWHRPYIAILLVLDFAAAVLASWLSISLFEKATAGFTDADKDATWFHTVTYLLLPLGWLVVLWGNRAYDRRYLGLGTDEFKRVIRAAVTVAASVSFLAFSTKTNLSRLSVATALVGAMMFILYGRAVARLLLHIIRRRAGYAAHRMVLVGTLPEALEVHTAVTRSPAAGLIPVAIHLTDGYAAARGIETPVPVYSGRDVLALVREVGADTIAVCGSASAEPGELRRLAWQLEGSGVDLVVAPQLTDIAGPRVHIRPIEGLPLLHVEEPTLSGPALLAKNLMDRVAAGLGLLVLLPVFAAIAIAIRISDPGPVFFRQPRVGHEGRTFRVWKFRTMYVDAEDRLAALVDQNETDGMLFKIRQDPRVFPVGRFLRASSLDELPQLINVLKGEMSLVGPRPLPADDGDFLGDVRRRLLVRPGMTGLWQVSGRSDLSWDEAVRLDLYYVDNWSLAYDLSILWRTIGVVLARKGAY
ncbi:Undecaprenyl-phosphate galactose phosphotransferase, WbaP/exopolysaccharide biosynthesis polyprenyl glycosylphosphotransferase [Micromonospora pattaloongensis]|uniref:Undecaprenyl-phosphate galactose phosphotransferase, WbaP/exopolysaccharide biosynthesis polyprenyl glycosylphosphotransferase n=1 Tax=Micromonospora pattaloongensis TaxID=405436 RepID=A0A1H3HPQ2_9ACTN|nr:sugar transferase [Micromonospora pattaloongensis]SDY16764.1 Undecaprenyl-phosphate galactose phosphotransferase, WbaP/exopolysaccharide biosynthesis polyprenyl glycosylphosphotransferase [Micromonospora pattaloongensis]